jgi:DNA-binding transcriptional MocR family regulator
MNTRDTDQETSIDRKLLPTLGDWSSGKGPLHRRLFDALRFAVERGDLPPGSRLPAERALAEALRVSRGTVVSAYAALRADGIVASRQGSGTWIPRVAVNTAGEEPEARRTGVFRSLIDGSEGRVEFLGAHLPGDDAVTEELLASCVRESAALAAEPGYLPLGLPTLRRAIARHVTSWGLPTVEDEILVTNGAQQAVSLVASLLVRRGDVAVIEDPTYIAAIDVLEGLGARIHGIPTGPEGAAPEAVRQAVEKAGARFAYLIPSFQNPTGGVMPERARRELARHSREKGLPILEDHTLADLSLGEPPPPPIASYDEAAPVYLAGSLSKIFWGGLRIGWIRAKEAEIRRLGRFRLLADLGVSLVGQVVATRLLENAATLTRKRREKILANFESLSSLLRRHLPEWTFDRPKGGLSLWVKLPRGDASEFARVAAAHGVDVVPGRVASPSGRHGDRLRLPFVLSPAETEEGVRRLAQAWTAFTPARSRRDVDLGVIV